MILNISLLIVANLLLLMALRIAFRLGVRAERLRWQQRCTDTLTVMEVINQNATTTKNTD